MMNATNGFTKQNWRVACLQKRKNPIVYVFPRIWIEIGSLAHVLLVQWLVDRGVAILAYARTRILYLPNSTCRTCNSIWLAFHEFRTWCFPRRPDIRSTATRNCISRRLRSNHGWWKSKCKRFPSWKTANWSMSISRKLVRWTVFGRSSVALADWCTIVGAGKSVREKGPGEIFELISIFPFSLIFFPSAIRIVTDHAAFALLVVNK